MDTRRAWVLNLDSDLELAAGAGYAPTRRVVSTVKSRIAYLRETLVPAGDVVVEEFSPNEDARGRPGRAFCPTPRALAALRAAGAVPEPHPSVRVLRHVNGRAFCESLGPTLPGSIFTTRWELAQSKLGCDPIIGAAWRVKHAFGVAGRNQRVILPSSTDERDRAFVVRGISTGGVQIEPNVTIEQEFGVHGRISQDGTVEWGSLVRQLCDSHGAWIASECVNSPRTLLGSAAERIIFEARRVVHSLVDAGYFGPFGVDSFTYRDHAGQFCVQPRSEINARYSMGFATGFAGRLDS